ncbi:MAG TPA: hypothetical protein VFQ76_18675 [Longimicrobiaceae bacterium]|nr:hypothetical protein [Longimicrobiaceae bacterium]
MGRVYTVAGRANQEEDTMARYEDDYHRRSYRGFSMRPEPARGDSLDPNYRGGEYRGMRMEGGQPEQAAYGRWRLDHARDLGGSGGFQGYEDREWRLRRDTGTYEPVPGGGPRPGRGYDARGGSGRGYEPPLSGRGYDRGQRTVENGGVRGDNRYLRQYNAASPALRGAQAYDRSYGHAGGEPGGRPGQGPRDRDGFQRDANRYGGYSSGGFGERWLPKSHP